MNTIDTKVRLKIYEHFLKTGWAPRSTEIASALGTTVPEAKEAMARLGTGKVIVLEKECGEVLMANPFCAVPTPFLVEVDKDSWFGTCIWDALGIIAMLKKDARIRTSCGCCSESMFLRIEAGSLADPQGVIHFGVPAKKWWDSITFS